MAAAAGRVALRGRLRERRHGRARSRRLASRSPPFEPAADGGTQYSGCGLTLSQQAWNDIANTNRDGDPLKVTVRATPPAGSCVTSSPQSVNVMFAKDDLTGGIYYWQSVLYGQVAGTAGGIYYHDFGTFDPTPTPFWTTGGQQNSCVGCHTLSKDGVQMALMQDDADADDEYGDVKPLTVNVPHAHGDRRGQREPRVPDLHARPQR